MQAQDTTNAYMGVRFHATNRSVSSFILVPTTFVQVSRVQPAVVMPLDADEEEVSFSTAVDTAPHQPYLQYGPDDGGGGVDKGGGGGGAGDNGGGGTCLLAGGRADGGILMFCMP